MSSNHSLGSSQSGNDVFNLRNPISSLALTPASNTNSTTVVRTNPTSSSSDVRTAPTNKSNTISTFSAHDGASKRLLAEYQQLQKNPVEGVAYVRPRESDLFNWDVAFFGAPDTPYQGGYFKVYFSEIIQIILVNFSKIYYF